MNSQVYIQNYAWYVLSTQNGYVLNTVTTNTLVIQCHVINIHSTYKIFIVLHQNYTKEHYIHSEQKQGIKWLGSKAKYSPVQIVINI